MNSEEENKRCVKVKLMYLQRFIIAKAKRNNIQAKNSMPQNVSLWSNLTVLPIYV
jgi:hypothetical protein